jgi:hypothetical protein
MRISETLGSAGLTVNFSAPGLYDLLLLSLDKASARGRREAEIKNEVEAARRFRYARMPEGARSPADANVRELYRRGDAVPAWVNKADLLMLGQVCSDTDA